MRFSETSLYDWWYFKNPRSEEEAGAIYNRIGGTTADQLREDGTVIRTVHLSDDPEIILLTRVDE